MGKTNTAKKNAVWDYSWDRSWWKGLMKKTEAPIKYKGVKNKTDFPEFIEICKYTQKELKAFLTKEIKKYGYKPIVRDGFIYAKGIHPVLLTAHMDTVHKEPVKDFYERVTHRKGIEKHEIASPQGIGGDDRCGIYMILQIIKKKGYKPYLLFCEDEEIGGVGSNKFVSTDYVADIETDVKFMIELDRANANDAVFYEETNNSFIDFVLKTTGYKEAFGSFSDISVLSPSTDVSSVNLSCGYYAPHTLKESVVVEEMLNTIKVTRKLIDKAKLNETPQYIYCPDTYTKNKYGYDVYGSFFDDEYFGYDSGKDVEMLIQFNTENGTNEAYVKGKSRSECWEDFFKTYSNVCFDEVIDFDVLDY